MTAFTYSLTIPILAVVTLLRSTFNKPKCNIINEFKNRYIRPAVKPSYISCHWTETLVTSLHSLVVRALDLKTQGCGFDSRAGQPNNHNCLSDETLNRSPL